MYELRNFDEFGFLIVLYVVIKSCYLLYKYNLLLFKQDYRREEYCIVYLLWLDNDCVNYNVGLVVELIFGNYKLFVGLDFVVVRINFR